MIQDPIHVSGFGLGRGVEIAVVVVPDVLLVKPGDASSRPRFGRRLPHVPVGHEVMAVGVGVDEEDDAVIKNAPGLRVVTLDEHVGHFGEGLRTKGPRWHGAPIDPDDRFALLCQFASHLFIGVLRP